MKLHPATRERLQGIADFTTAASGRHDAPTGVLDHLGLWLAVVIVVGVVALCVKFFLHPGERDRNHIKWRVLE